MAKRGLMALSTLIGVLLAIAGAILFATVVANIYSLLFPVTQVEKSTEATILELVRLVENFEEYGGEFNQNYFPGQIHENNGVIIFPKVSRSVIDASGAYVSKPPVKECVEKSCICVFDVSHQNCELPELSKSPLLKCYGLRDVDFVVSPVTYSGIQQGIGGELKIWKFYSIGDDLIEIEAELLGTNIYTLNGDRSGFAYMTMGMEQNYKWLEGVYDDQRIKDLKMGYTDPVFRSRSCGSDSESMGFYLEQADYGEKGVGLYLSAHFDPSIPFRKQAFENYLSKQTVTKQSGTT